MSGRRPQLQLSDVEDPQRLMTVLNGILLEQSTRIELLEAAKGVVVLPEISFETGGTVAPTSSPFSPGSGGVRVTCPFTPTGLVLLRLDPGATVSALASDVKWHFAAGPNAGDGVLHIDFVTGLSINSKYRMRVGVTRA